MWSLQLLSPVPFICAAMMEMDSSSASSPLQYGALGLCAVIAVWLCKHIGRLTDQLEKNAAELRKVCNENAIAYNRLANLLDDRPCLKKDSRIHGETEKAR